jgi:hypothetical protein
MRLTLVCLAAALPLAVPAHGEEPTPLCVHFTAVQPKILSPEERKAREPEMKKQLDLASKELSAVKKRNGKKMETWPEAERAAYREKLEATLQLEAEIGWLQLGERDIPDSLKDLQNAVRGKDIVQRKKVIEEVANPADAHLVVEVIGRRVADYGGGCFMLAWKATLGGRVDPARRASAYWSSAEFDVRTLHWYTSQEPFWSIETLAIGRWFNTANESAKAIERFLKQHHEALGGTGPL